MAKLIYDTRQLPVNLNVAETARLMRVTENHIRKLLRDGELRGKKIGKGWIIPKAHVLTYLEIVEETA